MTHTFGSEVSLHSWLLWPTVCHGICEISYSTRAIITRGLYIFYLIFYYGLYSREVNVTTVYVLKRGNSSIFRSKILSL